MQVCGQGVPDLLAGETTVSGLAATVASRGGRIQLSDGYERTCKVASSVIHMDGSTYGIADAMAFLQGAAALTTFKVSKKTAAGLDGVEHTCLPS